MVLKESLSLSYLTKLYLGMDGSKVNLKFQQDLTKYFGEKGVVFEHVFCMKSTVI